jgi:predicted AlkP superfamily pyrophosphatase or phosphodiesterase
MNKCDRKNSIVNLANSILKRFHIEPFHETNKIIDELIKDKKKVVVLLFDGLGKYLVDTHLNETSNLKKHIVSQMDSTFPPTTVAATNGFLSARFPSENGWMAWSQYFKSIDQNINVFPNVNSQSLKLIEGENIMRRVGDYKSIVDLINENYELEIAFDIKEYPIDKNGPKNLSQLFKKVKKAANSNEETFTYGYWTKPDSLIHHYGVRSKIVHNYIKKIDKMVGRFAKHNKNLTILVIADHGLVDVEYLDMHEHLDLLSLETRPFSFEKRAANFYVDKKYHELFKKLFNDYYSEHYELLTKDEVIKEEIFGPNPMSELAKSFLGDFLAIAKDKMTLTDYYEEHRHKAHHGGSTKEEREIYINYFEGKDEI